MRSASSGISFASSSSAPEAWRTLRISSQWPSSIHVNQGHQLPEEALSRSKTGSDAVDEGHRDGREIKSSCPAGGRAAPQVAI